MSDVDIVLGVAVAGVEKVYNLSNALQQLNRSIEGSLNPMRNLDARSRALSAAIGSSDSSLKNHAKTISEVARNNAILTNEMMRVRKEISGLGTSYKFASTASTEFRRIAVRDLKAYEESLKSIRVRALVEDLKSLSQEQKRLGKDAQFVGRSLIIGLTTPIMGFSRVGLQSLVAIDKEFVRLNKVLESVAPNLESAAKKMSVDLGSASKEQNKQLQTMVDRYNQLDKALTNTSTKFGLAKSLTVGLAGDFAELGIQTTENIALITELTAKTEKLGNMDIGAAKDLVQSLYFQALRAMQQSGESVGMPFQERERKAIQAATAQLNLFNSVENVTALTLRDLGDAFPEVAAAATSFGLSMTEAAALLAPMKAAGFETGASANSIKVSLQRLTAPTKQNAEMFKELSKQYNVNFNAIKGTGLDAIQQLVDGFNTLKDSAAGQEGAMEFFAKVFGVRQGPRMEVAIAQMAEFDKLLKNDLIPATTSAEKRLQGYANTAIRSANVTKNANLPVINSFRDIGIIARIATANAGQQVEGLAKRVTQEQINAAKQVREELSKEILKTQREGGEDLIGQVGTEAGRAMFIELAGGANAAQIAQRELESSLASLDTQLSILKNNFKMFTADLVKGLKPAIEKISELSTKLYNAWAGLDEQTKKLISTIALLAGGSAAAIGPLIFVFGQFRLAMGSIGKVLFGFLPGLKTMSIEALAAKSAMLNLTKPISMMGDTVVNTNGKFATFIATIASGNGPVGTMARRLGEMTGVLQKTSTAPLPVMRALMTQKADRGIMSGLEPALGAADAATPAKVKRYTKEVEEAIRKRLLRDAGMGSAVKGGVGSVGAIRKTLTQEAIAAAGFTAPKGGLSFGKIYQDITQQMLVASGYASVRGGRGARGFAKAAPDLLAEAEALQAAGYTSASPRMRGAGGRFTSMTKAQRDALKALEDAQDLAQKVMEDAKNASADIVKTARTKADEAFQKSRDLAARGIDFDPLTGQAKYRDQLITGAQLADVESGDAFTRFDKLGRRKVDYDYATGAATYRGRVLSAKRAARVEKGGIFGAMSLGAELFDIGKERTSAFGKKGLEGTEKVAGKFLGGKQVTDATKGIGAFAKDIVTKPGKAVGDLVDLFKGGFGKIVGFIKNPGKAVGDLVNLFKGGFGKIAGFIKNPMPMIIKLKGIIMGIGPAIISAVQSFGMFTGIGIVIAGVVAIVAILIKNWDQFVKAIQPGIETFKETFNILKDAVMGLVQPFLDFFDALSGDAEGSSAVVTAIATAFNILADVIKVVSIGIKFLFVEIFGRLIRSVLASVIGALRGVGNFIMGIWDLLKAMKSLNFGAIIDAFKRMGKGIAQVAIGLMGPFAGFFTFVLKGIKSIFDQLAKLPGWLGGGVFKKASQGIGAAIKFIDDTRSMEGKKGKGKLDAPDVDTDPLQEKIASASGDGMKEGADEGAKELAKRAKQALKDLKREVQEEIADRIKNAMESVVDQITEALKTQKEASLKVYDDQIKKIEDVAKTEGRLTKEIEYQNRLREAEVERSLNKINSRRSYALAVYAGQIDEARNIADASARQEVLDNEKINDINQDRAKEVAEQNRADLIDSIKDAKEKAKDYFDSMIKSFTDAAKKITEFPPTTAEEFNTMLNQLIEGGNGFIGAKTIANNMGTMFSQSFSGALSQLGVNASGPLTTSLEAIGKTLTDNNPFGPNGIWNKTIDESIDALTRKYQGLTNTLTTIINTKSDAFKNLYTIYKKYQDLVNPADSSGSSGGTGGSGKNTNGGYGSGFNSDGVKVGNKVAIASANADLKKIKDYSDGYLQKKYGNTAEGKRLVASIKGTVGSIASSAVLLGGHDAGMKDYMPIVLASKYKDQITTNSELVYAYIMNNRALFLKGSGAQGRTDESGRSGFFKGGMLPYMMGGATKGPTQQGIPALLHGGEYVVRNSAVKKYGWGMMQQINQGTYKPKPFAVGGMVQEPVTSNSLDVKGLNMGTDPNFNTSRDKIRQQYADFYNSLRLSKGERDKKLFEWQVSMGGLNYNFMREIWRKESKSWNNRGSYAGGGLGISYDNWRKWGGLEFSDFPYNANPFQQMIVYNRMIALGYAGKYGIKEKAKSAESAILAYGGKLNDFHFGNKKAYQDYLYTQKNIPRGKQVIISEDSGIGFTETGSAGIRKFYPLSALKTSSGRKYTDPRAMGFKPFEYGLGGLTKSDKTSAAQFRMFDSISDFDIQRITYNAEQEAKKKKKNIFQKIGSAVKSPFKKIGNLIKSQFEKNLYGYNTGQGITGSAANFKRMEDPDFQGLGTIMSIPSVRAGAQVSKSIVETGAPISGAYFNIEKALDKKRSGANRSMNAAFAALGLIGPTTVFAPNYGYMGGVKNLPKIGSEISENLDVLKNIDVPKNPMALELYRGPIVPQNVIYNQVRRSNKWEERIFQKVAEIYDISGQKVAFGVDKQFKSKYPFVKTLERNPYAIANVDPLSKKGVKIANDYFYAMAANFQENGAATRVDALLYAMTKGDMKAGLEFNRLAGFGRRMRPSESSAEFLEELGSKYPAIVSEMKRMGIDKFDPKNLFLVHETKYKPVIDKFGNAILKPTSDYQTKFSDITNIEESVDMFMRNFGNDRLDPIPYALARKEAIQSYIENAKARGDMVHGGFIFGKEKDYFRDTIHFALNHLVTGHGLRENLDEGYVIVANLMETLKRNPGSLNNLYAVDTYLTPKPGKGIVFPKGTFDIVPAGAGSRSAVADLIDKKVYPRAMYESRPEGTPSAIIPGGDHGSSSSEWTAYVRALAKDLGVTSAAHFESVSQRISGINNYELFNSMPAYWEHLSPNEIARLFYKRNPFTGIGNKIKTIRDAGFFNGGLMPGFANGGFVNGFGSQGIPAMLHGGEYVINSSAVRNLGISALQALNDMRFNTPKSPSYSGPVQPQTSSTSTVHIYVDNFIGEKQWFESMMKDYNINVAPQNQKAAGLNNTTISTYRGINRGL